MCEDLGITLLGSLPLEPKLARAADEGTDYLSSDQNSQVKKNMDIIVESKLERVVTVRPEFNFLFFQKSKFFVPIDEKRLIFLKK